MGLTLDVLVEGARSAPLSFGWRSLRVSDGLEYDSDSASLVVTVTRDTEVAVPPMGREIVFHVRRGGEPEQIGGKLSVTAIGGDTREGTITVEASAIAPQSRLREIRDASWSGNTIGEIASAIAARSGLMPAVSSALADVVPMGPMQSAESDIQFLRRLVGRLGGRVPVKDARLLILAAGERSAASGASLPTLAIDLRGGAWYRWRRADSELWRSASARFYAPDGSSAEAVTVGSGLPRRRLPGVFASRGEALRAARRAAQRAVSSQDWIEIEDSLNPAAKALYPLELAGAPPGFTGTLTVQEVTHTLGGSVARTVIKARP